MSAVEKIALRNYRRMLETTLDYFGTMLPGDPRDLYGDVDGLQPYPPGGIPPYYRNSQSRGEVLPVYTTWLQLKYIRDRSRRLCAENPFAICAMNNRRNYVVGDGFTYEATGDDEELVKGVQKVLDTWVDAANIHEYELDAMERLDKDGEFAIRTFEQDNGLLEVRFVEPEHIKDPEGDPYIPSRSFGIETDLDDVETIKGYHIIQRPWQGDTTEFVTTDEMFHVTLNTPRNAKRGLPTFYPVETGLRSAADLLQSAVSMAKSRAKIAMIRQMLNTTKSAADALTQSLSVGIPLNDPVTGQTTNLERMKYGTILTASGNVEYKFPHADLDAAGYVEILQAVLRAIAARLQMPEWMLTVDASNANLASSLVAEAPSVKSFRYVQRLLCRRFGESKHPNRRSLAWRQIDVAVRRGILPPEVYQHVSIKCEGPSLVVRNKAEEAEVNKLYYDMGIKSPQTIAQEQSLDYDEERNQRAAAGLDGAGSPPVITQPSTEELKREIRLTIREAMSSFDPIPRQARGEFTQPEFDEPSGKQLEPKDKTQLASTRANALKSAVAEAIAKYQEDPSAKNRAAVDKATEAYESAAKTQYELTPGEVKPTAEEFNDLLTTGPAVFISAGRNMNNPEDANLTDEQVAERDAALRRDLDTLGYKYAPLKGKYGSDEDSYLVKAPADKKSSLVALAKRYNQDAILHTANGKNEMIYTTGPNAGKANRGTGFEYKPDADDMYSEYTDPEGKKLKFALNLDFNEMHPVIESQLADFVDATGGPAKYKTEGFKNWFGDVENAPEEASKVVHDRTGVPITVFSPEQHIKTVYHGTGMRFKAFDPNLAAPAMVGRGFYFAENPEIAEHYKSIGPLLKGARGDPNHLPQGDIIKAHLNIRRPFDFDKTVNDDELKHLLDTAAKHFPGTYDDHSFNTNLRSFVRSYGDSGHAVWAALAETVGRKNVNALFKEAGYDGITHTSADTAGGILGVPGSELRKQQEEWAENRKNSGGDPRVDFGRVWVAFHPTQIKHVDNKGTFDSMSHNMYEVRGDDPLEDFIGMTERQAVQKYGNGIRNLRYKYLPNDEGADTVPDPEKVVGYNKQLDRYLRGISNGNWTLKDVLQDHENPLHTFVGEAVTAAVHGGTHHGFFAPWDSVKGVVGHDNKMVAGINRTYRQGQAVQDSIKRKGMQYGRIPVLTAFNPGGTYNGKKYPVSIMANVGVKSFSEKTGTPLVFDKSGDLEKGFLYNKAAIANAQNKWLELTKGLTEEDVENHNKKEIGTIGSRRALNPKQRAVAAHEFAQFLVTVKQLASDGDKWAKKYLTQLGIPETE